MNEFLYQSEGVGIEMVGAGDVRLRRRRDLGVGRRVARALRGLTRRMSRPGFARVPQID